MGEAATVAPPAAAPPQGCGHASARIWKLTPDQLRRTLRALVGSEPETSKRLADTVTPGSGLPNDAETLQLTDTHVAALMQTAAEAAVALAAPLATCAPGAGADCLPAAVARLGARVFRRPLTSEEVSRYVSYYERERQRLGADAAAAVQLARVLLMSPHFLFRTELGAGEAKAGVVSLTQHERASALSYLLADGPPDAELAAAADGGRLSSAEQLAGQARRLLAAPGSGAGALAFLEAHLGYEAVATVAKDPKAFPTFSEKLALAMAEETRRFVEHVLWQGDGRVETLFTAGHSVVDASLAKLYGVVPPPAGEFRAMVLPAGQRAGLLTQGSFLAAHASDKESSPVTRGKYVREELLCAPLPPPPANVNAVPPPPQGNLTMRERLAAHRKDPTCAPCHELIDPIGLAFEHYDAVGAYRTTTFGKPVDATGYVAQSDLAGKTVSNAIELARALVASPGFNGCFVRRATRYAHGRELDPADACTLRSVEDAFRGAGGDIRAALVAIVADPGFVNRAR